MFVFWISPCYKPSLSASIVPIRENTQVFTPSLSIWGVTSPHLHSQLAKGEHQQKKAQISYALEFFAGCREPPQKEDRLERVRSCQPLLVRSITGFLSAIYILWLHF